MLWNLAEQVKFFNQSMIFEIADLESLGRFDLKIAMCLIFMKFGNQKKSNMLIMNILIGIDYLDRKLEICEIWSQNWNGFQFLWNLALRANRTCWL